MSERPRDTMEIAFCETCGRDDRWATLKPRHFWHGGLCPGEVMKVVYRHPVVVGPVPRRP